MNRKIPLYQAIARTIAWDPPPDSRFPNEKYKRLDLFRSMIPHGAGIDDKLDFLFRDSLSSKGGFKIYFSHHHMNENGFYDSWNDYTVSVNPSLEFGFTLRIVGSNRNDILDHFYQMFDSVLHDLVLEFPDYPEED